MYYKMVIEVKLKELDLEPGPEQGTHFKSVKPNQYCGAF